MKQHNAVGLLAALLLLAGESNAATVVEVRSGTVTESVDSAIEISDQRARIVVREGETSREIQFDAAGRTIFALDHDSKSYAAVTEESLEQMSNALQSMVRQVESQLERADSTLSPEQKAKLTALLDSVKTDEASGQGKTPESARFSFSDESAEINEIPCRKGTLSVGGEPAGTLCVADPADIDIPQSDFETLQALLQFGIKTIGSVSALTTNAPAHLPMFDITEIDGLPVQFQQAEYHMEVLAVRQEEQLPEISIPEDYTRQQAPLIGQ